MTRPTVTKTGKTPGKATTAKATAAKEEAKNEPSFLAVVVVFIIVGTLTGLLLMFIAGGTLMPGTEGENWGVGGAVAGILAPFVLVMTGRLHPDGAAAFISLLIAFAVVGALVAGGLLFLGRNAAFAGLDPVAGARVVAVGALAGIAVPFLIAIRNGF